MPSVDALLVSTSQHLLAVVGDDVRIAHSGAGLYFGIASLDGRTYAACHHQVIRDPSVAELDAQDGSLLVLDEALREVAHERAPGLALRQPHGIAAIDGRIWVTCTYDDLVAIFDPASRSWERWEPGRGTGPAKPTHDDRFHYNAIRSSGVDELQLLAHNYGRSQVLTYGAADRQLRSVDDVGVGAHDLLAFDGRTVVSSSLEGALRSPGGWVRRVGSMPRGLALDGGDLVVGCSELSARQSRHATDGRLRWLGPDGRAAREVLLPSVGQVLDLVAAPVDATAFAALPGLPGAVATDPTLGAPCYEVPRSSPPLRYGEWHDGEEDQQWMASRRAAVPVVVDPGDTWVELCLVSHEPAPASARVALDAVELGSVAWEEPGEQVARFALPADAVAPAADLSTSGRDAVLTLEVPSLWQPDGDPRSLGVGLRSIRLG